MKNASDAFEQRIKDSLDQFEVPYNSSDWAQLEKAMDGPRNVRWWATPGVIAALVAGTLVVGGTGYLLTQRNSTSPPTAELNAPPTAPSLGTAPANTSEANAPAGTETSAQPPASVERGSQASGPNNDAVHAQDADGQEASTSASPNNLAGKATSGASGNANSATTSTKGGTSTKDSVTGTAKDLAVAATPALGTNTPKSSTEMTFKASVGAACPGEEVTFRVENMPEDGIYLWNFGDGSFSNKANPEHTFTKPGNYQVMLSMSAAGVGTIHNKPSSDIITIHETPKASFNALKQEFEGHIPSIHFENRSNGAKQYHWEFGDGSTSTVAHPDHIYKKKGLYTVKLTVTSEKGCVDVHQREVRIDNDYNLDAPANFAPSAAETFMPEALRTLGVKFHLMVYTQAGQLVYETSDATKPWTGRMNNRGEVMAAGDYVWVVDVRERLHLDETYTGKVTLKP